MIARTVRISPENEAAHAYAESVPMTHAGITSVVGRSRRLVSTDIAVVGRNVMVLEVVAERAAARIAELERQLRALSNSTPPARGQLMTMRPGAAGR